MTDLITVQAKIPRLGNQANLAQPFVVAHKLKQFVICIENVATAAQGAGKRPGAERPAPGMGRLPMRSTR